jgi:hypothetical protein
MTGSLSLDSAIMLMMISNTFPKLHASLNLISSLFVPLKKWINRLSVVLTLIFSLGERSPWRKIETIDRSSYTFGLRLSMGGLYSFSLRYLSSNALLFSFSGKKWSMIFFFKIKEASCQYLELPLTKDHPLTSQT